MKYSLMLAGVATAVLVPANTPSFLKPLSFCTLNVNTAKWYQMMISRGCSGAFSVACQASSLLATDQQMVVNP